MASLRPRIIALDSLRVFLLEAGDDRLPLLILHGFASSALAWARIIETLGADRHVVAYDRPGFGLTVATAPQWKGLDPYGPDAQVPIATELLEYLGIHRCVVLGHSMGGRLAYELAVAQPERVAGLILVAPAWERPSAPRVANLLCQPIVASLALALLRMASPLAFWAGQRLAWASSPPRDIADGGVVAVSIPGWEERLWRVTCATLATPKTPLPALPRPIPTVMILGERDRIVSNARSRALAPVWRAGGAPLQVVSFERSGHLPHLEESSRFVETVKTFLQEVEDGAAATR
jgi:pimeloyl-ACP methyl ester carboxylesterase